VRVCSRRCLLNGLGIKFVTCYRGSGSGEVSFTMAGEGGAIDTSGASLPSWVSDWLRAPGQDDVLKKLAATTAPERHVFVPVDLHGAGWPVESYLLTWLGARQLPSDPPDLPEPVTAVWLASTMADRGVRWDGRRRSWFVSRGPEIDDAARRAPRGRLLVPATVRGRPGVPAGLSHSCEAGQGTEASGSLAVVLARDGVSEAFQSLTIGRTAPGTALDSAGFRDERAVSVADPHPGRQGAPGERTGTVGPFQHASGEHRD
jgi:hypothetical protein